MLLPSVRRSHRYVLLLQCVRLLVAGRACDVKRDIIEAVGPWLNSAIYFTDSKGSWPSKDPIMLGMFLGMFLGTFGISSITGIARGRRAHSAPPSDFPCP